MHQAEAQTKLECHDPVDLSNFLSKTRAATAWPEQEVLSIRSL